MFLLPLRTATVLALGKVLVCSALREGEIENQRTAQEIACLFLIVTRIAQSDSSPRKVSFLRWQCSCLNNPLTGMSAVRASRVGFGRSSRHCISTSGTCALGPCSHSRLHASSSLVPFPELTPWRERASTPEAVQFSSFIFLDMYTVSWFRNLKIYIYKGIQ